MLKKIIHDMNFEHGLYVTDVQNVYDSNKRVMWQIDNSSNIQIIENIISLIKEEQSNTNDLITKWTLGRILDKIYSEDFNE